MTTEQLAQIIDRYLTGIATPAEKGLLQQWFDKTNEEQVYLSPARQQQLSRDIWKQIRQPDMPAKTISLFSRRLLKYAAAVLILAAGTIAFLSEKKLAAIFSSTPPLAYEQVITAPGKVKTILLPDSSRIHLFPNSKLSVPENYGVSDRTVLLEGKAFFDIHADPQKQFRVQADQLITTVLGTSFEINAFPSATQMTVMVATGKVSIAYQDRLLGELSPNKKLSYHLHTATITTAAVDATTACNWINGQLIFRQTPLPEACDRLSEWFHVNIIIDNPARMKEQVTVGFRGESLEKILSILSQTTGFTYTIDHHNIHIH
jgi:transmembrane sensor